MPRQVGSRVMSCACGGKVVGMPGQTRKCNFCGAKVRVTKKVVAKKSAKKVAIRVVTRSKKVATKATKPIKAARKGNGVQQSAMA